MAITYKVLGQASPSNTSEALLYQVGSGKTAIVSSLVITNITGSAATFTVFVAKSGEYTAGSPANKQYLAKTVSLAANAFVSLTLGLTLSASDAIYIISGTGNALAYNAFGQES